MCPPENSSDSMWAALLMSLQDPVTSTCPCYAHIFYPCILPQNYAILSNSHPILSKRYPILPRKYPKNISDFPKSYATFSHAIQNLSHRHCFITYILYFLCHHLQEKQPHWWMPLDGPSPRTWTSCACAAQAILVWRRNLSPSRRRCVQLPERRVQRSVQW